MDCISLIGKITRKAKPELNRLVVYCSDHHILSVLVDLRISFPPPIKVEASWDNKYTAIRMNKEPRQLDPMRLVQTLDGNVLFTIQGNKSLLRV